MVDMKILHTVEFYEPSIGGMQEVVKQLSEILVKKGHSVTVATSYDPKRTNNPINGVTIKEFDISGNLVRGMTGPIKEYENFLLNSDFDIITNFAAQQWATDIMLPIMPDISTKKVFVPTGFSGLFLPEYKEYFEKMKNWLKLYDRNVFLSNTYRDIDFARKNGVKNIVIIPNGASSEEFSSETTMDIRKELGISKKQFLILHVGSHTGLKGHSEAIEIFRRTNLKNAVLVIVGRESLQGNFGCFHECKRKEKLFSINPINYVRNKKIIICSLNREQTVALYKAADLFLFPSNVECSPIVLFECMASKTPFLTTDVGNSAEIIQWSNAGELLPTYKNNQGHSYPDLEKSVRILEKICHDKEYLQKLSHNGFHAWVKRFTWEAIASEYENLYLNVI
ncbi:MAG: glycosyltransferase family 4 protein, partial [Crenarchaeota archaeon]|nr:glycosyltransferase family 4 protein [Thermoproteota archaeon]